MEPDTYPSPPHRRQICGNCDRPKPVCLCHFIPSPPIPTTTRIIIVQHPHESRHKLNTTPLLTKSLLNATAVVTRRLTPDHLRRLLPHAQSPPTTCYLFPPSPSSPAVTLSRLRCEMKEAEAPRVLIAFDATWGHAREMVRASEGYLGEFATRVCLDGYDEGVEGGSMYDEESELVLRKEPCGGCVSTAEAAARWLGAVEKNGPVIEATLVGVLREMVRLQAQFLKPMKPRSMSLKKNSKQIVDLEIGDSL